MKPYIQIVDKSGNTTYMHDDGEDFCDVLIDGVMPNDFGTTVTDRNGQVQDFVFDPESVGRIISRTVAQDTKTFVEKMFGKKELCEIIESHELFFGVNELDEGLIEDFVNGLYGLDETFFFRLVEEKDGKWILCFVFGDEEEVRSLPTDWPAFSR